MSSSGHLYHWFKTSYNITSQLTEHIIPSFVQDISIAPLQVHYYSEALPTQHGYCAGVIRHRQVRVKDLPTVPTWQGEQDSNPWPFGWKATNLPMSHHTPQYHYFNITIPDALLWRQSNCLPCAQRITSNQFAPNTTAMVWLAQHGSQWELKFSMVWNSGAWLWSRKVGFSHDFLLWLYNNYNGDIYIMCIKNRAAEIND